MRKNIYIVALLFLGCSTFPTSYNRIESDKVRLIDFIYEPSEAAPGDTVTIKAIFSGKEITPEELSWKVSTRVVKNIYGMDTAFDIHPLQYKTEQCYFSDNTSCISVEMVIPEDILYQSPMIPDDWQSGLPR